MKTVQFNSYLFANVTLMKTWNRFYILIEIMLEYSLKNQLMVITHRGKPINLLIWFKNTSIKIMLLYSNCHPEAD